MSACYCHHRCQRCPAPGRSPTYVMGSLPDLRGLPSDPAWEAELRRMVLPRPAEPAGPAIRVPGTPTLPGHLRPSHSRYTPHWVKE